MSARAFFESLWSEPITAEADLPPLCRFATQFQTWAEALLTETLTQPSLVSISRAKILLVDKYFEWRAVAPRGHRDKVSGAGHICIWQIFEAAYNRLREAELSFTRPLLFEPAPLPALPASPPQSQHINGIFIAEEDE